MERYNAKSTEKKWQNKWEGDKIIEINAIFSDEAFNRELNAFMEASKE